MVVKKFAENKLTMKKILFSLFVLVGINTFGQIGQTATYTGSTTQGTLDGELLQARYSYPTYVAKDGSNNIYVADNGKLRKIDESGNVVTISTTIGNIHDMAFDATNNTFIISTVIDYEKVLRIDTNGNVLMQIYANGSTTSSFGGAWGVEVDNLGNIYYSIPTVHVIQKYVPSTNTTTTYAGTMHSQGNINGTPLGSLFSYPRELEFDSSGNLYITDQNNTVIKKVSPTAVSSITSSVDLIYAMSVMNNVLYFSSAYKLSAFNLTTNSQQIISGTSNTAGFQNGNAADSKFDGLTGILALNPYYLLVCDYSNHQVRRIQIGDACANASVLSSNSGTVNIGTISGTIPSNGICYTYSQSNPNANWWSFTPTQSGLLDITTVTPQNAATVDTRLSVFTGNCGALSCFTGSDNISGADLRSNLNDITLTAGTTYYFVFDDKVSDNAAVNFYYEFTPQTCFRPNSIDAVAGSNTEVTYAVDWDSPTLGDTTPDSFTIQIGPEGYTVDSPSAIQTYVNLIGNSATLTGLTPNTVYDFYIKSVCSPTDVSVWYGPFKIMTEFTAVSPTYSENFDSAASFLFLGWSRSGGTSSSLWRTYTSGPNTFTQSGQYSIYSPIEPAVNTPANAFAYTRKMNLLAGQNYKVSYYPRTYIGAGVTLNGNMDVFVTPNTDYTNTTTHTAVASRNLTGQTTFSTMYEDAFTVPSNGVYRVGFKNGMSRTAGTATSYLMLDTVVISTMLSVDDFNASGLSMFPNPVLDHVSIANNNVKINTYAVVDSNGRTLISKKYNANNNLIDLSSLAKGIYFIQLETEKGTLSKKIIKE